MKRLMHIYYKGKKINIIAEECGFFRRFTGLMLSGRKHSQALLFSFKKPVKTKIHSFFVFFPFIAVWLDNKNNVLALKIVRPFTFSVQPKEEFLKIIEIPVNKRYKNVISAMQKS